MRLSLRILFTVCALGVCSRSALANPRLWTLAGVTFDDGGTASGSFVYDADLNQFSAVNVTTTTGAVLTGATLSFVGIALPFPPGTAVLTESSNAMDLTGTRALALFFDPVLTDLGGTVSVSGLEASCLDPTCSNPDRTAPYRSVNVGGSNGMPQGSEAFAVSIAPAPTLDTTAVVVLAAMLVLGGFLLLRARPEPTRD